MNDFLPNFEKRMESLLRKIVNIKREGIQKGGDIKNVFVTGIPNLGNSDQIYLPTEPATPLDMNIPGLRQVASAICLRMNAAILKAIKTVQAENGDIPILFEDISDIPVHGIHPTKEGDEKIARRREARCDANFSNLLVGGKIHNELKTFADAVELKGNPALPEAVPY